MQFLINQFIAALIVHSSTTDRKIRLLLQVFEWQRFIKDSEMSAPCRKPHVIRLRDYKWNGGINIKQTDAIEKCSKSFG